MPRQKPKTGTWCHVEIPTRSITKAKKFYGKLFGWKFEDMPGAEYSLYETPGGGVGGGLCKIPARRPRPVINYVQVDRIEPFVRRVTRSGGSLAEAKQEVPGFGWYAVVKDPDGNPLGLWQSAQSARSGPRQKKKRKK
jgi:predicted enzyme related to lactoylglutathione lyase